eukprot:5006253-Pyramimonas_sp.AAC.1
MEVGHLLRRDLILTQLAWLRVQGEISLLSWVLRGMSNMGTILVLEQGREKMVIPGSDMYKLPLEKGAGVFGMMETPSGHLAFEVDEHGVAIEDERSIWFTIPANPHCEEAPLLVKEAVDAEPAAVQPASSSAGAHVMSDARAYDVTGYQGHQLLH